MTVFLVSVRGARANRAESAYARIRAVVAIDAPGIFYNSPSRRSAY